MREKAAKCFPGSMLRVHSLALVAFAVLTFEMVATSLLAQQSSKLEIRWDKVTTVSKSTPTLQVVVNPPLRPGEALGVASYSAIRELGADYVRYVPWLPYPKLAVAELEPPTPQKTSWDFSLIDPMTRDFLAATEGHPAILNFSTSPAWLYKTEKQVTYPADPNKVVWDYTQGTELRDPSGKELGDYYARLVSWYANGGFSDENGVLVADRPSCSECPASPSPCVEGHAGHGKCGRALRASLVSP